MVRTAPAVRFSRGGTRSPTFRTVETTTNIPKVGATQATLGAPNEASVLRSGRAVARLPFATTSTRTALHASKILSGCLPARETQGAEIENVFHLQVLD